MTGTLESLSFGPLTITYDERVLAPRPWTAMQSRWAVELLADAGPGDVLELCSGAGHIGLLVVAETRRRLVAVDLSPVACAFTRANADAAGLGDLVEVREGRLEEALRDDDRFVLVVADPPWVGSGDVGRFPDDPLLAIDGGNDGLDVAWSCIAAAEPGLVPGGSLLLQLGDDDQADRIASGHGGRHRLTEAGRRQGEGGVVVRLVADA